MKYFLLLLAVPVGGYLYFFAVYLCDLVAERKKKRLLRRHSVYRDIRPPR